MSRKHFHLILWIIEMECGVVCVCVLACREKWKAARFEQVTIAVEQTTQNQLLFFFCVRAVMTMLNALRP